MHFPREGRENVTKNGQNGHKPHDDAGYRQRRKLLLESAGPASRCWRCGKLASEHPRHRNGRRGHWQAGHVVDGDNRGPLRLEWSTCNTSAGGRLGNARRWGRGAGPREAGPHFPSHYNLTDASSVGAPPCVRATGSLCSTCAEWRARS